MKKLVVYLSVLMFASCLQPRDLFDIYSVEEEVGRGDLMQTSLFKDYLSNEVWFSDETGCIEVKRVDEVVYEGKSSLLLEWNKLDNPTAWVGMGFGWDDWSGKDIAAIIDNSAIQMRIKSKGKQIKSLPLAFAMEDHSGAQAWTGFLGSMLDIREDEEWDVLSIPLSSFNWSEQDADPSNVKQFMIQFEASGQMYVDDIRIVEFDKLSKKNIIVDPAEEFASRIYSKTAFKIGDHQLDVGYSNEGYLFVKGNIVDKTPMKNGQTGSEIWNGDCIEIAFSANSEADPDRKFYHRLDRQVGLKASDESFIWDWKGNKRLNKSNVNFTEIPNGYFFEARIDLSELGLPNLKANNTYGIEIAIDLGDEDGRERQERWNSSDSEGFNLNPSLWGTMKLN